jgi:hypothetical protein
MVEIGIDVFAQKKAERPSPESAKTELARVARIANSENSPHPSHIKLAD